MTLAAVLWDMDGTLVDTEPYWMEAEETLASAYGKGWTHHDAMQLVGNDLLESGRYMNQVAGIPLEPGEIVDRLLDAVVVRMRERVPWCEGAIELLAELGEQGVACGLVTMSYRRFVDPVLERLPRDTFSAVVTGDVVERGKPHPEPYLMAASLLGVDPSDCIAIEDSNTGASSAEAAGCRVLVVPNHVEVPRSDGRVFADSLLDLDLEDLLALW